MRVKRYFNNLASSSRSKSSSGSFCLIGASGSCNKRKSPPIHTMSMCFFWSFPALFYNLKSLFYVGTTICPTHVISSMILPWLSSLISFIPPLSMFLSEGPLAISLFTSPPCFLLQTSHLPALLTFKHPFLFCLSMYQTVSPPQPSEAAFLNSCTCF